ncbi:MAG: hypothetical protein HYU85_01460 [Chloroflexi bacterium]|nr:hypothetical protein [Chloroflexota bacterium]MBI3930405.1 hypothetical protein [Chloroflexota bacterium]
MRLLRIAVEKQRWDLAAHTIVLATASVLKNGDKLPAAKRVADNASLRGVGKATSSGRRDFEREKRRSQR